MKTTSILMIIALLIGLSFSVSVCNAQKSNEESFFEEDESPVVNNVKNERTLSELEKVQKENADLKKLNDNLRAQADERAELENKLLKKDQENKILKDFADANKAEADSAWKSFLNFKMQIMQKEEAENSVKVNAPVVADNPVIQENPVPDVDTTKKTVSVPKKRITQTPIIATKNDTGWVPVPVNEKRFVPIHKKGTITDDGETINIRESDLEKYSAEIEFLHKQGRVINKVKE